MPVLWLVAFFVVPVAVVALYSVGVLSLFKTDQGFTLFSWKHFLGGGSVYLGLFWKSIRMSLTASVVVVLLAYPVAYYLALVVGRRKYTLLLLAIAPFLTSYLLRVFAWKVILGNEGLINSTLVWAGLRQPDHPVTWLLYSNFTVILVLIYVWVPFAALPIFVTLENLEGSFLEAAQDLGAGRLGTFLRITLPMSAQGLAAAFVFVFIPTIGEFVTPSLVGGPRGVMYGNAISELFNQGLDWRTGSVLALFLVVVVVALLAVSGRLLRLKSLEVS